MLHRSTFVSRLVAGGFSCLLAFACGDDGEEPDTPNNGQAGDSDTEAGETSTGGIGGAGAGGRPSRGGSSGSGGMAGSAAPPSSAGSGGEAGEPDPGDACSPNPCRNAGTCASSGDGYVCTCTSAFTGARCTDDVNECLTNNGGCGDKACVNTFGTFSCGNCPEGYSENVAGGCDDIDECLTNNGDCDQRVTCVNTPGGRTCTDCPDGYFGEGNSACIDTNECLNENACDELTNCTNLQGTFRCSPCPTGYSGMGKSDCVDIDECDFDNGGCEMDLRPCLNSAGSFSCGPCIDGYVEDGDFLCDDIDECEDEELYECEEGYECENKAGGYDCVDIDECETDNGGCSELRDCVDSDGSFSCDECPEGWDEDGDFDCICEESLTECVEGTCVDTETDPEFCGDCENACDEGASCENGECLSVGLLGVRISWDEDGDGDLFVTTPNANTIWYDNPGPVDGGVLEVDNEGLGPENIFWPIGNTPPTGTYFVCWNPYSSFVAETVNVTATVSIPGEDPIVFMEERSTDFTVETCSDMTSSFLFSFEYPPAG